MIFTKFHENRLIIDEINEKHALLVSCGLRYTVSMGTKRVDDKVASFDYRVNGD